MSDASIAAPGRSAARAQAASPARWVVLGVLFGLLSATAIVLYGPIGVSTTYPRFVGALMKLVAPGAAATNPYLQKVGELLKPETMVVVGLLIGGFLARMLSGEKRPATVERIHTGEATTRRRYLNAFFGGVLIIFGARLAGGCTSGHIISGITQLAVSGMLFGAGVFGMGIVTARLLKGGR